MQQLTRAQNQDDLERDIFGDGSELSSEEDGSYTPLAIFAVR